jgi:hypothetical protein
MGSLRTGSLLEVKGQKIKGKRKKGLSKPIAVVGGGHHSEHQVLCRSEAPEKMRIGPFGKLWVNSLKATTAGSWGGWQ